MPHLEEQSLVLSLVMPNLLQDNVQKLEDSVAENEMLTTSCAISEPSLHNAPITPAEIESKGNAHGVTDGETCFDVLNSSTNHAFIEQLLV